LFLTDWFSGLAGQILQLRKWPNFISTARYNKREICTKATGQHTDDLQVVAVDFSSCRASGNCSYTLFIGQGEAKFVGDFLTKALGKKNYRAFIRAAVANYSLKDPLISLTNIDLLSIDFLI